MGSKLNVLSLMIRDGSGHGIIPELHEYSNLETLEISSIILTESEFHTVFASLSGMHVQTLVLYNLEVIDEDVCTFFPLLAECPSLRELEIDNIPVPDPDIIYNLLQIPLNRLILTEIPLDDRCAEKIAQAMYQNRTPRILDIRDNFNVVKISENGWRAISRALGHNTSLVGLDVPDHFASAINRSDRLHFFNFGYGCAMDYAATPRTLRFVTGEPEYLSWQDTLRNLERLVFARFPVEHRASVFQFALDQTALHQKVRPPSLPDAVRRLLHNAVLDAGTGDRNLERWTLGFVHSEEDPKIAEAAYYEVKRLESADFDWIPDIRVLYPFRNEVLKLTGVRSAGGALVHPADTEWQARLADAADAAVLVCVPDDADAAVFEALARRHAARGYVVAIVGNPTPRTLGSAERYLPDARRVFAAPDVAGAVAAAEKHVDRASYAIRDLLVYHECLASGEMLLTLDDADRIAMRCGFGPHNWARVARFPGVWTLPGVGVAPSAARFVAYLDAWLSPSGAVHATPWRAREGAAFAARLRAFTVSPEHLAKIVRQANELVDVSVDAVVDALAALGVVVRVAGGPLLVVRGRRPDALAALHARLLERPAEFAMVAPRGEAIDFVHAGTRYAAGVADGAVKITDVAADRLAPLALRQALLPGPGPARDAPEAKRRAP